MIENSRQLSHWDYMDREDELILLLDKANPVLRFTVAQLLEDAYSTWYPIERLMS